MTYEAYLTWWYDANYNASAQRDSADDDAPIQADGAPPIR
jgi:hypothetical protein